jgi:hypothetical protein
MSFCNILVMPFFLFVQEAVVVLAPCCLLLLPPLLLKVGIPSKEKK